MPSGDKQGALQIGEWVVTPSLDSISKGTETQKLEPRTMRLLLCLADSAGEVVSVDRLLSEVWTGVVVGSASVYQAVSQLRKLLGDVDPEPTYIVTVPAQRLSALSAGKEARAGGRDCFPQRSCSFGRRSSNGRCAAAHPDTIQTAVHFGWGACSGAARCRGDMEQGIQKRGAGDRQFNRGAALHRHDRG